MTSSTNFTQKIRNLTDNQLQKVIEDPKNKTLGDYCEALGIPKHLTKSLSREIKSRGLISPTQKHTGEPLAEISDKRFKDTWDSSISYREVVRKLRPQSINSGSIYPAIKKRASMLGLNDNHMLHQGHSKGKTIENPNYKYDLKDALIENSPYSRGNLKRRLLKTGLLQNICSECETEATWNGAILVLHLDHINGINDDNRLENLRILCPICHALTPTFRGRNNSKKEFFIQQIDLGQENTFKPVAKKCVSCKEPTINGMQLCLKCSQEQIQMYDINNMPSSSEKKELKPVQRKEILRRRNNHKCKCGKIIDLSSSMCIDCMKQERRKNIPSKQDLILSILETNANFSALGRKYGVSDNAVRKWCKYHGLPVKKADLFQFFKENKVA